jgi:hypothetical protein
VTIFSLHKWLLWIQCQNTLQICTCRILISFQTPLCLFPGKLAISGDWSGTDWLSINLATKTLQCSQLVPYKVIRAILVQFFQPHFITNFVFEMDTFPFQTGTNCLNWLHFFAKILKYCFRYRPTFSTVAFKSMLLRSPTCTTFAEIPTVEK